MNMNEDKARSILGCLIKPNGSLYNCGMYINWSGEERAILDGKFTVDQLSAIVWWMQNIEPKTEQ